MNARFLLDTNVVSATLGPAPKRAILRQIGLHQGHIAIASVTWHELQFGVERLAAGRRQESLRDALRAWQDEVPIVEYDADAAEWHARERARLLARGRALEPFDGQIAAIAATRQLTIVTSNTKDFRPYEGLTIVDWSR